MGAVPEGRAHPLRTRAGDDLIRDVSVSEATTHALEEALQAVIVGMRLDAIYEAHPEVRPSEAEVAEMAERSGVSLP